MSEYLVEVKRSARRSNAAVGSVVCRQGVRHRFESRDEAESWAAAFAADGDDGEGHVWIRAANPDDRSDVDAYLIGWLHRVKAPTLAETPGEQTWLADYRPDEATADADAEEVRGGEQITDWLASE